MPSHRMTSDDNFWYIPSHHMHATESNIKALWTLSSLKADGKLWMREKREHCHPDCIHIHSSMA